MVTFLAMPLGVTFSARATSAYLPQRRSFRKVSLWCPLASAGGGFRSFGVSRVALPGPHARRGWEAPRLAVVEAALVVEVEHQRQARFGGPGLEAPRVREERAVPIVALVGRARAARRRVVAADLPPGPRAPGSIWLTGVFQKKKPKKERKKKPLHLRSGKPTEWAPSRRL